MIKEQLKNIFEKQLLNKKPLFVLDMANNHNGNVEHGLKIIREIHEACKEFKENFLFALKFQYRDLDSFIHPDYKDRKDLKYVKRFSETRLREEEFIRMKEELNKLGFITMCTPFDEKSVDLIEKQDFEIIKIASCSFTDWPLLERIAKTNKPIIASTAGAGLEEIDQVVLFFKNRNKDIIIMHCVGEYPIKRENLQLNQIGLLQERYPDIKIGFSTHEEPDNIDSIKIAIAKGANVFERHVDVESKEYTINAYSSTPTQINRWLQAAKEAYNMCGIINNRHISTEKEKSDLRVFKRGVFAKLNLKKDDKLIKENIFYAFPCKEGQLVANELSKYISYYATKDINEKEPILFEDLNITDSREKIKKIVYGNVKEILKKANLPLNRMVDLEISHHYGIDKFYEFGCVMITCVNRDYCKKIIIILPGQTNPTHVHKLKEESFIVDYGDVIISIDGKEKEFKKGDLILVKPSEKHSFTSKNGGIFEEISTTHFKNDSYYEDESINKNSERKTFVKLWLDD